VKEGLLKKPVILRIKYRAKPKDFSIVWGHFC
jgi:hypothetical protein